MMESERPIEKALRATAQKRRDEAGPPLELHPATRKLLQNEVARKYAASEQQTNSRTAWARWRWPRFALGVATAAVVVVLAAVFGLFKSDESSTFASRGAKEQMDVAQSSAPQTESRSSTPAAAEPTAPELHSTLQSAGEREQALVTNGPLP